MGKCGYASKGWQRRNRIADIKKLIVLSIRHDSYLFVQEYKRYLLVFNRRNAYIAIPDMHASII